ncbi:hypothetical protein Tco_0661368 [Tanacetum coccineum]
MLVHQVSGVEDSDGVLFVGARVEPKGADGILKKINRIMANLEFLDEFVGAQAIFQPYHILDHSLAILKILRISMVILKPFKFYNILIQYVRFKDMVKEGWKLHISVFYMFRFVKILQHLKRDFCKLLYNHRNLHDNVKLKGRISRSRIDAVTNLDGLLLEADHVSMAFFNHYPSFLGQQGVTSNLNTHNLFIKKLDSNVALDMITTVTTQEVKNATFSVDNDKSPGPDGYTAAFFKEAWDIVEKYVTNVVQEFFINGKLLKEVNQTIIALIPMVASPSRINNYRPISCCNVMFKRISDNILLTQEIMHNYHLDHGPFRCAFKFDIQKAYDTVDWGFLKDILMGFGFYHRMIHWIMECVSSTSFSLSINGLLHGYFKGQCGLYQGIINLFFMDDLFLFVHGDAISAHGIMEALDEFKFVSGFTPSLPKSTAYFCNVLNHTKLSILQILPFEEGRLLVKYLGVPLISSRLASVFILLSRILLDIEQLMRGFLWSQGDMRKSKAKVAWEVVCLPKKEGGLGLRNLVTFNKALSHIWRLLSLKESLWVKWIHVYNLRGRNFWDVPIRGNIT